MIANLFRQMIAPHLNKALVLGLLVGVAVNSFLCYERKVLQAQAQSHRTEVALIRADNQNLANQLERANAARQQYEKQVQALHHNLLTQLQHAETRSNEILKALEKNQHWRNQPLPTELSRLLNNRQNTLSHSQTAPAPMPTKQPVPTAPLPYQK